MVTDISTNNQNDLVAVCDINGEAESAVGAKLITVIEKFQRSLGEQKIRKKNCQGCRAKPGFSRHSSRH